MGSDLAGADDPALAVLAALVEEGDALAGRGARGGRQLVRHLVRLLRPSKGPISDHILTSRARVAGAYDIMLVTTSPNSWTASS